MPDDVTTPDDEEDLPPIAHDDIMKRLLDYQRQLRGADPAATPETARPMVDYSVLETQAATATATEEVVDLAAIEEAEEQDEIEVVIVEDVEAAPEDPKIAEAEAMRQRVADEAAAEGSAEPEPAVAKTAPAAEENLAERVAQLEDALDRIGVMLASVRSDFQDLAIRADERISEIEESLAAIRGSSS